MRQRAVLALLQDLGKGGRRDQLQATQEVTM